MKFGVKINTSSQPSFPAEPKVKTGCRSKFNEMFRIHSDPVHYMKVINWIRFGSYKVRRLNRAFNGISNLLRQETVEFFFYPKQSLLVTYWQHPNRNSQYKECCIKIKETKHQESSRVWTKNFLFTEKVPSLSVTITVKHVFNSSFRSIN